MRCDYEKSWSEEVEVETLIQKTMLQVVEMKIKNRSQLNINLKYTKTKDMKTTSVYPTNEFN